MKLGTLKQKSAQLGFFALGTVAAAPVFALDADVQTVLDTTKTDVTSVAAFFFGVFLAILAFTLFRKASK